MLPSLHLETTVVTILQIVNASRIDDIQFAIFEVLQKGLLALPEVKRHRT